ncbi:hypothetical protein HLH12_03295 [Acinetobacter sp. NIPH 2377]|uniref:sugar-transfer associated ATP-grasp domain-containing protein n=1 Tax=Acinetobacter terrestris TaxID=2529843 RepID=UPI00149025A2|nr:sugar-transfer associated ATP-grasp domain-containing protein [Acinetobacter terrestris]NNH34600.1 hypothetical protein [Acinetobacter terrestris]
MKEHIKQFYIDLKKSYWNQSFNKDALFYLRNIESREGKLNKSLIKICDEYALDCFKSKVYAPWLYVYTAMHKEFKEGWIPDNYFGIEILPKINGSYGKIASLRPLNKKIFNNSVFFSDVAYISNKNFFKSETLEIINRHEIKDFLFANTDQIVFKENDTAKGNGIYFFHKNDFDIEKVSSLLKDGVFQPKIVQNDFFSQFNNSAVASIRISTMINRGKCEVKFADIRLPNGNITHIKVGGHVRIPINLENGTLNKYGYLSNWQAIASHPQSNIEYANKIIPKFNEMIQLVKSLHLQFPLVKMIGWDLIIDDDNQIQILEWNGSHPGIKFAEATVGPIFNIKDFSDITTN